MDTKNKINLKEKLEIATNITNYNNILLSKELCFNYQSAYNSNSNRNRISHLLDLFIDLKTNEQKLEELQKQLVKAINDRLKQNKKYAAKSKKITSEIERKINNIKKIKDLLIKNNILL